LIDGEREAFRLRLKRTESVHFGQVMRSPYFPSRPL
jgi:hypothetical protein